MKSIMMLCAIMSVAWGVGMGVARAEAPGDAAKQAARSVNEFGWDLYHRLCAEQQGNLFMSPYSIDTALAMAYGGAQEQTAAQMARTLHFERWGHEYVHRAMGELIAGINAEQGADAKKMFDLVVANALWMQKGMAINPEYQKLVGDRYEAALRDVDFSGGPEKLEESRQTINDWVAKKTNDKIKDLLAKGSIDTSTQLVLTNAIYFKSVWQNPFDKKATRDDEPFHAPGGDVNVSMMHQKHKFDYTEGDGIQVLALPYQNGLLTMVVVLPRGGIGPDDFPHDYVHPVVPLADVEKSLDVKQVEAWIKAMKASEVVVSLPKFTFTSSFSLGKALQSMGMTEAFGGGADFSGMEAVNSPSARLCISDVIHKAFVDVNEESTEAAAATGIPMHTTAVRRMEEPVIVFNADHPFVFVIRDNASGAILFVGRVSNPKS